MNKKLGVKNKAEILNENLANNKEKNKKKWIYLRSKKELIGVAIITLIGWIAHDFYQEKSESFRSGPKYVEIFLVDISSGMASQKLKNNETPWEVVLDSIKMHGKVINKSKHQGLRVFPDREIMAVEFEDHNMENIFAELYTNFKPDLSLMGKSRDVFKAIADAKNDFLNREYKFEESEYQVFLLTTGGTYCDDPDVDVIGKIKETDKMNIIPKVIVINKESDRTCECLKSQGYAPYFECVNATNADEVSQNLLMLTRLSATDEEQPLLIIPEPVNKRKDESEVEIPPIPDVPIIVKEKHLMTNRRPKISPKASPVNARDEIAWNKIDFVYRQIGGKVAVSGREVKIKITQQVVDQFVKRYDPAKSESLMAWAKEKLTKEGLELPSNSSLWMSAYNFKQGAVVLTINQEQLKSGRPIPIEVSNNLYVCGAPDGDCGVITIDIPQKLVASINQPKQPGVNPESSFSGGRLSKKQPAKRLVDPENTVIEEDNNLLELIKDSDSRPLAPAGITIELIK